MDYESVTIDGQAYTINEKGEAVDAAGNVVKTFDEVKALLKGEGAVIKDKFDTTDITGLLAAANAQLGLDFTDENGAAITFEPTVEGMAARDQFIIDRVARQMAQDTIDAVIKADTDFESLYWHKQKHGTAVGWSPAPDYDNLVLMKPTDAKAEEQYLDIIIKGEIAAGRSPEQAKLFAKYLVDDGKGEESAKAALDALKGARVAANEQARAKAADDARKEAEAVQAYWNKVKSVVDKGQAKGVAIPAFIPLKQEDGTVRNVPRQAVFEFMSKPVQDGKSALQLYNSQMDEEARVLDALLKFTNYGYADIIKAGVNASKVEAVRRVKAGGASGQSRSNPAGGKSPVDSVVL